MEQETVQTAAGLLSGLPPYVWAYITIIFTVVVAIVAVTLVVLLKNKEIKTKSFSITEKEQIQAESRELSDNQMRTAKIHIGSIRILVSDQVDKQFEGITPIEKSFMDLLVKQITDNLLEQFRIDLVRNHIVKKTDEELKVYTQAKAQTYYTKIKLYLNDYNYVIRRYDFKKLVDAIPFQQIYDIYYESYMSAKQLSVGY